MLKRDTKKFNPQSFVETQAKKIAQSDRLHSLFKFIKFNYILDGHDMKILTKELYEQYLQYVALTNSVNKLTKNKMISLLREHGIDYRTSNGRMSYNISNAQLRDIGTKYKFFFEDDAEEIDENRLIKIGEAVKLVMSPNEAKLQAEIDRLNKIIDELKQTKPVDLIPDDEALLDDNDDEIEVINTNINMFNIPKQPAKIKKTQDINNIITAFDTALKKMKS